MSRGHPPRSRTIAMTNPDTTTTARADLQLEPEAARFGKPAAGWRRRLHEIVFESDTQAGKVFDIMLIAVILLSIAAVVADSVEPLARRHGAALNVLEWV